MLFVAVEIGDDVVTAELAKCLPDKALHVSGSSPVLFFSGKSAVVRRGVGEIEHL